jgi:hypothetical protein
MYPHSDFLALAARIALHGRIARYFVRPVRPILLLTALLPPLFFGVGIVCRSK